MESLSVKYRPQEFKDVSDQRSLIKILERQIETESFKNCIILQGPSGTGKTTIARIFARKINNNLGEPIEIDAASNNSVENVRQITESAVERSLDSKYKVYIIDEAHMITNAGWNAFLKCIEEPPKYTVFIFCTTDYQKIPLTISNRCQVFNLSRVNDNDIKNRLLYICKCEGIIASTGIDLIVKMSQGSMRQAISYLDKCKDFSNDITLDNVIECLGNYSYDVFFNLTNSVIDGNKKEVYTIFDSLYNSGTDLKLFVSKYFEFVLQLLKYIIFKDMSVISIPESLEESVKYATNIDDAEKFFSSYLDRILKIKQSIKGDSDIKTTIEVMLLSKN